MRNIFARYGLPTQVVSDNGAPFQSAEYEEFLRQNGIQRILVSPHHPSSNGLAERFVQTFKYAVESTAEDPASSIQRRIQNFLLSYRSKPHAKTAGADLGGGCRGCAPLPEMTCGFLIQLVFCKKKKKCGLLVLK